MKIKLLFSLLICSVLQAQIPAYYSSIDFTQTGNTLKSQLTNLITTTHTTNLSYTPGVWEALKLTDLNPNNSNNVFLVYGYNDFNASVIDDRNRGKNNNGGNVGDWNREHCYPKSLGNPDLGTSGPGADAHHLRASDVQFNNSRGNRLYADSEGDAGNVGIYWYPGDEWKGDIARMMMYMYVRYQNQCLATAVGAGSTTYSAEMPDIFLEWNEEDPVNFYERNRNDILEGLQGNRNPFIDNPYLATQIWGGPQAPDSWNLLSCPTTTTWNGLAWDNGAPNKTTRATINGNYTSTGNLEFCSLEITGTAQVTLQSNHTFTVVRDVNVAPTANFTVQNNANLVQINNIANTGNITVLKESAPIIRLDYTSWSSPVSGQNLLTFSPSTQSNRFYEYVPSGNTPTTAYASIDPTVNDFLPTKAYIIRAPNNWSASSASAYSGQFTGTPNNGEFNIPVVTGFNMLGNPYPATIEASHFIATNRTIETLYFWTHTVAASGGLYPQNNFASYTTLGGVASAAGGQIPDGTIKPGQGFYVNSIEDETVLFHNALRYDVKNTQFFRDSNSIVEKDIYRLNLTDSENSYNQILIGHDTKATNGFDIGIDGKIFDTSKSIIYTVIDEEEYAINGLPEFNENEKVALGFKALQSGNYSISLENTEGIFNTQTIYLKDNFNGNITDIKENPYSFHSEEGVYNSRFEVLYKVNTNDYSLNNDVVVYTSNNQLEINAFENKINRVTIYDITGKKIAERDFNSSLITFNSFTKQNQALLLLIKLENGNEVTKKIIF
ncbi:endonuclease [Flavobacterium sp. N2270]|uniref:endonuclease n=1 Tax=Flavobacterium sp. N2270 TaxID=2986831 RepID=UPI0022247E81|nr:endonuclease [Flavobacterium sp. N2270]